jgi:hypothetical protein
LTTEKELDAFMKSFDKNYEKLAWGGRWK